MRLRVFETEQWLARPIAEVFAFFSDATNLDAITPPWLQFHVVTPAPIVACRGTLIDYRLRVHGVPMRWQSEITSWDPPHGFVDEQRRGPYRRWVHRHQFEELDGGTWIRDHVEYAVPGFVAEPLLHRWFVRPDLDAIFAYRQQKLLELLAVPKGGCSA
jgi:ligand-binding SRPBCC domain-containing protein